MASPRRRFQRVVSYAIRLDGRPLDVDLLERGRFPLDDHPAAYHHLPIIDVIPSAEEVATLIILLASERTGNVTGANYVIDGGLIKTT